MDINLKPIGVVRSELNESTGAPRHYTVSDKEGIIEIFPQFAEGLYRVEERSHIAVIFLFHRSRGFSDFIQHPPTGTGPKGVFSTCSPNRPNPIGMSIVELKKVDGLKLHVKNIDMLDGTPVLDIKPFKPGWGTSPQEDHGIAW